MARRSWRVGPDQIIETRRGQIAIVSRQAQIEAIADAVTCADRLGGTIAVLYGRVPTGIEGEMATSEILVNWQDRTDAKPQYEESVAFEPTEPVELIADVPVAVRVDGLAGEANQPSLRILRLAERDGWACHLCGSEIDPSAVGDEEASADHLKPKSEFGGDQLDNLKLAHRRCNQERGNRPLAEVALTEA